MDTEEADAVSVGVALESPVPNVVKKVGYRWCVLRFVLVCVLGVLGKLCGAKKGSCCPRVLFHLVKCGILYGRIKGGLEI